MKRSLFYTFVTLSLSIVLIQRSVAQDTTKTKHSVSIVPASDTAKTATGANTTTTPAAASGAGEQTFANLPDTGITDLGVAVAPANIRYRTKPGSTETKYITVTNDTHKPEKFKISVSDFDLNDKGGLIQLPMNETHEYGLTKWISVSPGFIELKPGEKKKVAVTLTVPEDPKAYRAGWALVMIDQTKERSELAPKTDSKGNVVMGVIPVFGFGVYIFQNPPNVKLNKVEIVKFNFTYDDKNRFVSIQAKNIGDGMGFCKAYVEINNLNTGYKEKLFLKQCTIFPGKERNMEFQLPGGLTKGKYIATAVLDFGSDEQVARARHR